jgi:putative membrane protein
MLWKIILALVLLLLTVIVAIQNAGPVALKILVFNFETSLSLVLFLTLIIGIIVGLLLFLPIILKTKDNKNDKIDTNS